jgi:CRP-like cAMP-binding protein
MADHRNFILSALGEADRNALLVRGKLVPLIFADTLLEPGQVVDHVYFPEHGVISIITEASNGETAEGGVTGSEGAAALPESLGSGVMRSRGVVQAAGSAWRIPAQACRDLYARSHDFRCASIKAAEFQVVEARQSLLCRSRHAVDKRLARWLLEMSERGGAPTLTVQITQEILGFMLAVTRTTVTEATLALRRAGLISATRGRIVLVDIPGLERAACACRATVRDAEAEILGRRRAWPPERTSAAAAE